MIFKLSNLPKFFHTYICPRFYGGGTPANTTSTTTVNQSPWQNPVYQALMLGTAEKPGPMTSMLNNNRDLMAQWNAVNSQGLAPAEQAALGTWNPAGSQAAYVVEGRVVAGCCAVCGCSADASPPLPSPMNRVAPWIDKPPVDCRSGRAARAQRWSGCPRAGARRR